MSLMCFISISRLATNGFALCTTNYHSSLQGKDQCMLSLLYSY